MKEPKARPTLARARCLCGAVRIEMQSPAMWAWHDHTRASRHAHGAAAAVWVGTWKSRMRLVEGEDGLTAWRDPGTGAVRSFCSACGTPMLYERAHSPKAVNIPRAAFETGVGREPRYHIGFEERPPWAYREEAVKPLKGFPGVVWTGAGRRRGGPEDEGLF